ncbi:hypothetical protein T492DRAFT_847444 [Pavlovales sp. CCMP2436]|nr:hypothetical protein T492DRAFT_847444 [Pavlovales sp. CCMP2436]
MEPTAMALAVGDEQAGLEAHRVILSLAQLAEIWAADEQAALGVLSRLALQPKYESDLRQSVYVDFLYSTLLYCRHSELSVAKTFAAFDVSVEVLARACAEQLSKEEAFGLWSQLLMARIKALPLDDSMSLAEVQALTAHATAEYFNHFNLHQHVFTQSREGERRRGDLFVELAGPMEPLSAGTPVVHAPAAAPHDEAAPLDVVASSVDVALDAAPAVASAAAPAATPPSDAEEMADAPEVDAAIAKLVELRVAEARAALAAEFDRREVELTERISQLEVAAGGSRTASRPASRPSSRAGLKKK